MSPLTAETLLADDENEVRDKIADLALVPHLVSLRRLVDQPSWASAWNVVHATEPLIHACLDVVSEQDPGLRESASSALHLAVGQVCANGWLGSGRSLGSDLGVGVCGQLRVWAVQLQSHGSVHWDVVVRTLVPGSKRRRRPVVISPVTANYVVFAGLSQLWKESRQDSYVAKIERIATVLALSPTEMARMLDVSREGLRRWLSGSSVAPDRWRTIDDLDETVDQLAKYIKLERLPAVARRPAEVLGGASPLDWLVARRHRELLAEYRKALSYQVPL